MHKTWWVGVSRLHAMSGGFFFLGCCIGDDDSDDSDEGFVTPQHESSGHASLTAWSSGTVTEVAEKA